MRSGSSSASSRSTPRASIRRRRCARSRMSAICAQLSPEGVLGLNPSLILATEGAGPKETIAVLRSRRRSVRAGAGQLQRQRHSRKDRDRSRRGRRRRARRLPRQGGRRRSRCAGARLRSAGRAAAEGDVRAVVRERPGDGGGPQRPPPTASSSSRARPTPSTSYEGYKPINDEAIDRGEAGRRAGDAARRSPSARRARRCSPIRPSR